MAKVHILYQCFKDTEELKKLEKKTGRAAWWVKGQALLLTQGQIRELKS